MPISTRYQIVDHRVVSLFCGYAVDRSLGINFSDSTFNLNAD